MKVKIKDTNLCETCINRTCAFVDVRMKEQFYSIRTETTVCPMGILMDETKSSSFGDKCINCALCVQSCFADNLEIVNYEQDFSPNGLLELQYNAIALGYLDKITGFAANTNRNRSMNFDGFLQTRSGESCFVEVDYNNDSLECCRRLIGAFITYEGHIGPIRNGLIVLQEFPREGSRDVFNVIDKLSKFPTTKDCCIYFCTFSLLRHMMLKMETMGLTLADLFYNPQKETVAGYLYRIDGVDNETEADVVDMKPNSDEYLIAAESINSERAVEAFSFHPSEDAALCNLVDCEDAVFLFGCYKNREHLKWAMSFGSYTAPKKYNIRLNRERHGAVRPRANDVINAKFLVLYNIDDYKEFKVFAIEEHHKMTSAQLSAENYPSPYPNGEYMVYTLGDEVRFASLNVQRIIQIRQLDSHEPFINGQPFFLKGKSIIGECK